MKKSQANTITGGLSRPSKMPGKGFSIPAAHCRTGSKLRKVPGSVCASCYALKGRYVFANVQRALQRRYNLLSAVLTAGRASVEWVEWIGAMETLITPDRFFRFHDSGDLQSIPHLALYCDLSRRMKTTKFWLPTKETRILRMFDHSNIPPNLCVRYSATMIDGPAPSAMGPVSLVWSAERIKTAGIAAACGRGPAIVCPANKQGNKCGECRACWSADVRTVIYPKH